MEKSDENKSFYLAVFDLDKRSLRFTLVCTSDPQLIVTEPIADRYSKLIADISKIRDWVSLTKTTHRHPHPRAPRVQPRDQRDQRSGRFRTATVTNEPGILNGHLIHGD